MLTCSKLFLVAHPLYMKNIYLSTSCFAISSKSYLEFLKLHITTNMHFPTISLFFCLFVFQPFVYGQLDYKFYDYTCPNLTKIVRFGVWSTMANDTRMAASLLRLHFHDCISNGCDASVLLDETSSFRSEKDALPNRNSARGFELIESIKADVEKACPKTVSCIDILTLAVRDAVLLTGGRFWPVALGRRDGLIANITAANTEIPSPFESLDDIIAKFTAKGLNIKDVVALSGAHTIGFVQCFAFKFRLFNFSGSGGFDPSLDASLASSLQTQCPNQDDSDTRLVPLDPVTTTKFDNMYFRNLVNNSGILGSDQALMSDNRTAAMVINYSKYPFWFAKDFSDSMVKLSNLGVITGQNGQVRDKCNLVN